MRRKPAEETPGKGADSRQVAGRPRLLGIRTRTSITATFALRHLVPMIPNPRI